MYESRQFFKMAQIKLVCSESFKNFILNHEVLGYACKELQKLVTIKTLKYVFSALMFAMICQSQDFGVSTLYSTFWKSRTNFKRKCTRIFERVFHKQHRVSGSHDSKLLFNRVSQINGVFEVT